MLTNITRMHGCLMVTVPDDISLELLAVIREDVLDSVQKNGVRGVIFDLSSVRIIDYSEFSGFIELGRMTQLLGAEAVFLSIRPGVVSSLIDIGIGDIEIRSFLTIEAVLEYFGPESSNTFPLEEEDEPDPLTAEDEDLQ